MSEQTLDISPFDIVNEESQSNKSEIIYGREEEKSTRNTRKGEAS
jgi:predicted transcriptional regulator